MPILVLFLFAGLTCGVLAGDHGNIDDQEQFENRIAEVVERILADKIIGSPEEHILKLQKRVLFLERKVQILEAKDRRRGKVIDGLLNELDAVKRHPDGALPNNNSGIMSQDEVMEYINQDTGKERSEAVGFNALNNISVAKRGRSLHTTRRALHQVAFSAYMDQTVLHVITGDKVMCNGVFLNEGNAFDVQSSVFTVPVNGVYLLAFDFVGVLGYTSLSLVVNGNHLVGGVAKATAGQELSGGNMLMVYLKIGQTVWVSVDVSQGGALVGHHSARYLTFSGILLY